MRNLTEQQQKFLDVLYEEAKGDVRLAMKLAGYSSTTPSKIVTNSLSEEITELTQRFIAQSSTKAVYSMFEVMQDPTKLGNKDKMLAAKDILDRAGFGKVDKVELKAKEPVFILPAKRHEEDEVDDEE
jgi:hypothetical protein